MLPATRVDREYDRATGEDPHSHTPRNLRWGKKYLNARLKNVEDIYPLSPMQEAMLLHALSAPHNDVLFNQFCYEISGCLDVPRLRAAWDGIIRRHPPLRSAFIWDSRRDPLQVVRRQVDLPFLEFDWSCNSADEQESLLARFRTQDREQGFDPKKAPLMRLAVAKTGPNRHYLVWTSHHLVLDRWCLTTIFEDLFSFYEGGAGSEGRESPFRYRDYIGWIKAQDHGSAERFWRTSLAGFHASTRLSRGPNGKPGGTELDPSGAEFALSPAATTALRGFAATQGLTISTIVQGALALTMNHYCGRQDVAFGATVSGRPASIPGVEHIVGSFVGNVPLRVRMSADATVTDWLRDLQLAQQRRTHFDYVSPAQIHEWSELAASDVLFDTLLVWLSAESRLRKGSIRFDGLPGEVRTAYPLTITVEETKNSLIFRAMPCADHRYVDSPSRILEWLGEKVMTLSDSDPRIRLSRLTGFRGSAVLTTAQECAYTDPSPRARVPVDSSGTGARHGGREWASVEMLQDLLSGEWRRVLEIEAIGPDDDFFQAGGNSLTAAGLHARIESALRCRVPMISLFQAPTIRQMAELLAGGDWPKSTDIAVPLRAQGSYPALFCIASPEVNTVGYALLARYLDPGHQVHVVQALPDSDRIRRLSPAEIPQLASQYVDAIRQIQPAGPYQLLGMCTGSQVTLEIARRLVDQGQSVSFVGVINTWALYTVSRIYHLYRLKGYIRGLYELALIPAKERRAELRRIVGKRIRRMRRTTPRAGQSDAGGQEQPMADTASDHDPWIEDYGWVRRDPGITKYPGTVTVFRIAPQQRWRTGDPDLGWGRHAARTEIVHLPGSDHDAIMREPNVRHLGEQVRRYQRVRKSNNDRPEDIGYGVEGELAR